MILNHKRVRQILHGITIAAFTVSVLFQLKNLYVYGGKPPKQIDDDGDDDVIEDDNHHSGYETKRRHSDGYTGELNGRKNHE